ncbi:ADP-dependent glucokinase/phosphofructokinase [Solwaraspora sp. WMMA2101]|uniref:ADP-dependent glucokinase/phosphofructokinase n=1 Tax=Solwaraspora sp. WMMA2101 TaxID=3404124 RepID=UPI003B952266
MADASRIVLGLGGCVDYEVKLTAEVMQQLVTAYGIGATELAAPSTVASERDLVVSILSYVARGGGGEHYVAAAPALESFANRLPRRVALGGTSVRAGILMSRLGVPSTLHLVTVNDTVRRLLPPEGDHFAADAEDTLYPHLIVQYDQGLRIRAGNLDITAPFPNRLIYVNDPANGAMPLSGDLGERLSRADLFLISGLNAMRCAEQLDLRLTELRGHLRRLPAGAVTYFEDAAYHEPAFSRRVLAALRDAVDVYGLNEDELQSYLGHPVDLLSATEVADALTAVNALVPAPTVVLHTRYWAVALGPHASTYADSLDAGTVLAAVRYRHGDDFTDADIARLRRRPRRPESVEFAAALRARMGETVHCVPAFALDVARPTTVGLGDTFVGGFLAALAWQRTRPAGDPTPFLDQIVDR